MSRLIQLLAASVVLGSLVPAVAQQQPNLQQLPDLTVQKGTVLGFQQGLLHVSNGEQSYLFKVAPQKALITGPAMPDILANGMFVNFTIAVDAKLVPQEEIAKLEVYTPSDVKPLGTQAEGDKTYIAGQITSINKTGKISVKTPKGIVKGQLAEDCAITLAVNDPSVTKFIREGDTVMIFGKLAKPSINDQPGLAIGLEFEIMLNPEEPLTRLKKKPVKATDKPGADKPGADKPGADKADGDKPGEKTEKPAAEKPAAKNDLEKD